MKFTENPSFLACGRAVVKDVGIVHDLVEQLSSDDVLASMDRGEKRGKSGVFERMLREIEVLAHQLIADESERKAVLEYIQKKAEHTDTKSYSDLLGVLISPEDTPEQELDVNKVNILTMHRAKGLSSKAVIILAAEEELLPGRSEGEGKNEQRRLLYVSLTRAEHRLYITYCNNRTGSQRHTGSSGGSSRRHLTPFLRNVPPHVLRREDGIPYIRNLKP